MTDVFQYANHTNAFHQRTDEKTSMMMATSDEEFSKDLDKCNEYVQVKDVFAFPFGLYNERNVNLLKEKGFTLAFTTITWEKWSGYRSNVFKKKCHSIFC